MFNANQPSWRDKYQQALIKANRQGFDYVRGFSAHMQNLMDALDFFQEILSGFILNSYRFTELQINALIEQGDELTECVDQIISDLQVLNTQMLNYRHVWAQDPAVTSCQDITYLKDLKFKILEPEPSQNSQEALRKLALLNLQNNFVQSFYYFKVDLQEILFYVPEAELHRLFNKCWDNIMEIDQAWMAVNQSVSDVTDQCQNQTGRLLSL